MRYLLRLVIFLFAVSLISEPTLQQPVNWAQQGEFAAALLVHPDDPALLEQWIQTSIKSGDSEQAATLIRRLAALKGWTPEMRLQLAVLLDSDASDLSFAFSRSLLDGSQDDVDGLRHLLAADLAARDWIDATNVLRKLSGLAPTDANARYQLAMFVAPDDPRQALSDLGLAAVDPRMAARAQGASRILTRVLNDPPAARLTQLALWLISDNQWSLAEFVLNRLIALDGGSPTALALSGVVQDQQGRDGKALIDLALARAPDDPTVNYAQALHWRLAGDLDQALQVLEQAVKRNPQSPALAAEIGTVYRLRGLPIDAARWYELAVQLAPQEIGFQQMAAAFYADEDFQIDGAGLFAVRRAAANFPDSAEINAIFGQTLLAIGQRDAAKSQLERALALDAGNVRARYYRAILLEQLGKAADAVSEYRFVYASDDANFHALAARALERLGGTG